MKILVVEDEVKMAEHLKGWLKHEGYIVETLYDGEQALDFILMNHETIDLVLLDEMLPQKMGSDVCRAVRQQNVGTPICMLTAKDMDGDVVAGLHAGADDYLTKPFSLSVLSARIQALLRRPRMDVPMAREMKVGHLSLDRDARIVRYGSQKLSLTLKEYNILECLMEDPNRVIDREELLEKVWDANFTSFSNVVDVQVTRLRKKLQKVGGDGVLETVRGVGFRLRDDRNSPT